MHVFSEKNEFWELQTVGRNKPFPDLHRFGDLLDKDARRNLLLSGMVEKPKPKAQSYLNVVVIYESKDLSDPVSAMYFIDKPAYGRGRKLLKPETTSDAEEVEIALALIDELSLSAHDYILESSGLTIRISNFFGRDQYKLVSNDQYEKPMPFLLYLLSKVEYETGTSRKRKIGMPLKRALASACISVLMRNDDNADKADMKYFSRLFERISEVCSISVVQKALDDAGLEYGNDNTPLDVKGKWHFVIGVWLTVLCESAKGTQQLDAFEKVAVLLGDAFERTAMQMDSNSDVFISQWFTKLERRNFTAFARMFVGALSTLTVENVAVLLLSQNKNQCLPLAMKIELIAHVNYDDTAVFFKRLREQFMYYVEDKVTLEVLGKSSVQYAWYMSRQSILSIIARENATKVLSVFEKYLLFNDAVFAKEALSQGLNHTSVELCSYLDSLGISVATVKDKSYANYPTLKQCPSVDRMVAIIINAHTNKETGVLDQVALLQTVKDASESMKFYIKGVMNQIEADTFFETVTTKKLLKWYLEAKELEPMQALSQLKNQALRKKLMKEMFE